MVLIYHISEHKCFLETISKTINEINGFFCLPLVSCQYCMEFLKALIKPFMLHRKHSKNTRVDLSWQPYPRTIYGSIQAIQNFLI